MSGRRILIYGNSGSGKTTMATELAERLGLTHLSLDAITWEEPMVRKPVPASITLLKEFITAHPEWVIEGCYADVIEAALADCSELYFLNPGVEVCVTRCRERVWEPSKFASRGEQDLMLERLIEWVRQYELRDDEYGLRRHRALFVAFAGDKREVR